MCGFIPSFDVSDERPEWATESPLMVCRLELSFPLALGILLPRVLFISRAFNHHAIPAVSFTSNSLTPNSLLIM